jgi:hypothetical protein
MAESAFDIGFELIGRREPPAISHRTSPYRDTPRPSRHRTSGASRSPRRSGSEGC